MDINQYVKSMKEYSKRIETMTSIEKKEEAKKSLKAAGLLNSHGGAKRVIVDK